MTTGTDKYLVLLANGDEDIIGMIRRGTDTEGKSCFQLHDVNDKVLASAVEIEELHEAAQEQKGELQKTFEALLKRLKLEKTIERNQDHDRDLER